MAPSRRRKLLRSSMAVSVFFFVCIALAFWVVPHKKYSYAQPLMAGSKDYYRNVLRALVTGEYPQGMNPSSLHNQFRVVPVPLTLTLEDFTEDPIINFAENHITYVLFGGTRNNDESWRPISENDEAQLEQSVEDLLLVPLSSQVADSRQYKQTLRRRFATNYSKMFYSTASEIVQKVAANDALYRRLNSAFVRRVQSPDATAQFDWKDPWALPTPQATFGIFESGSIRRRG